MLGGLEDDGVILLGLTCFPGFPWRRGPAFFFPPFLALPPFLRLLSLSPPGSVPPCEPVDDRVAWFASFIGEGYSVSRLSNFLSFALSNFSSNFSMFFVVLPMISVCSLRISSVEVGSLRIAAISSLMLDRVWLSLSQHLW